MTISILSNIPSLRASNDLNRLQGMIEQSAARLSTGKRILSAADDPSGVGILSTLNAQSVSYGAVERNIGSGVSILETASAALDGQQKILQQMKDLATQAASDVLNDDQRNAISKTFQELQSQLDTSVDRATIFGKNLVGASGGNVVIQSGINAGDTFTISAVRSDAETLGVQRGTGDGARSVVSGEFGDVTLTGATTDSTFTLSITDADGADVTIASFADDGSGDPTVVSAADIDAAIADATLPTGVTYTGSAVDGDLQFFRADGEAFTIKQTITAGTDGSVAGDGFAAEFATSAGVETAAGDPILGIRLTDSAFASLAMTAIDEAIATVATNQSILGAQQNGLTALSENNKKVDENIQAAISRIQDVDIAKETANLRLLQAREQFSTALLGVINNFPSTALALLR